MMGIPEKVRKLVDLCLSLFPNDDDTIKFNFSNEKLSDVGNIYRDITL